MHQIYKLFLMGVLGFWGFGVLDLPTTVTNATREAM